MGSQGRELRFEARSFELSSFGCKSCMGMVSEDSSFFPDHQMTGKEGSRSVVKPVMPKLPPLPWVEWGPARILISFGYLCTLREDFIEFTLMSGRGTHCLLIWVEETKKPREECGKKMVSPQLWGGNTVLLVLFHGYSRVPESGKLKKPIWTIKKCQHRFITE